MIPQIIILVFGLIGLGFELAKHGEVKIGKYNFWILLLTIVLSWSLLYWGGFWNPLFN